MASTLSTKLLVLCSAAVGAAYAGAYFYTQPTASAAPSAAAAAGGSPSANANAANASSPSSSAPTSQQSSSPTNSAHQPAVKYKDGTYTGTGSNVYGQLTAEVTIAGGKITKVHITSYYMHYPQSYVDPQMTNEFVQMQTYRVYAVSGATASSYAYAEAVYYALRKAKA